MFVGPAPRVRFCVALRFVLLTGLVAAVPVRAQEGTPPPPSPPPADSTVTPAPPPAVTPAAPMPASSPALSAGVDSSLALPLLVEPRPREEIYADITAMTQLKAQSLERASELKLREVRKQSHADIKKTEIASLRIQINLARKEKQPLKQKELEGTRKKLEAQQKFLERLRDLFAAEGETRQATAQYAQSRVDECKAELKLYDLGDLLSKDVRMSAGARGAQVRVIAALKDRADKMSNLGARERDQADRRKSVLDAYAEMIK